MIRVSSSFFYTFASNEMLRQEAEIAKTQEQISTGKRLLRPSDNPVDAARAINLQQHLNQLDQYERKASFAEQNLNLEDTHLSSLTNLLHRVKELSLAANSGAISSVSLNAHKVEIQQRFSELVSISNYKDEGGNYIFSGYQGRVQPFTQSGGAVNYNGDQGVLFQAVGPTRTVAVNDTGYEIFQKIRNGNGSFSVSANPLNTGTGVIQSGSLIDSASFQAHDFSIQFTSGTTYDIIDTTTSTTISAAQVYTDGSAISFNGVKTSINGIPATGDEFIVSPSQNQSLFTTFQNLISALSSDPLSSVEKTRATQLVNNSISDLDQSLNHILNIRTDIGARLNSVESARAENDGIKAELKYTLSKIQDLDYSEAISRLQFQMQTLQAAQQTFKSIEGLSLFDFIR